MPLFGSKKIIHSMKRDNVKHVGNSYCLNCLYSFRTKNKLESHEKVCEKKDFCGIIMSSEDTNIL